jgi:hypothetical protein
MTCRRLALAAGSGARDRHVACRAGSCPEGRFAAQGARINALNQAGKYAEALPLAQAMVASLEKGNDGRELSAALNYLGQVNAGQARDGLAEPIYKRAIALMEKSLGPDTVLIAPELNNLAARSAPEPLHGSRTAVQARAGHSRKGAVARASGRRPGPQQSRHALRQAGAFP